MIVSDRKSLIDYQRSRTMSLMPPRNSFPVESLTSDDLALACSLAAEYVKKYGSHDNPNLQEALLYLERQFKDGNVKIKDR